MKCHFHALPPCGPQHRFPIKGLEVLYSKSPGVKWALLVEKWSTLHDFNDTFDIREEELITWDTAPRNAYCCSLKRFLGIVIKYVKILQGEDLVSRVLKGGIKG